MKIQPPPLSTPLLNPMPHAWQAWFSDLKNKDEAVINLAHNPVTVVDSASIDFTLATQVLTGSVKPGGLDHSLFANLNSSTYSHLTGLQLSALTGGANTTLHSHAIGGPGSGLDADTIDGLHADDLAAISHIHSNLYNTLGVNAVSIASDLSALFAGAVEATGRIKIDVATGSAPIEVISTTVCSNLNVDLLDGNHASAFSLAGHTHAQLHDSVTLATDHGLSLSGQQLAMGTPSTLTAATTNTVTTTTHTHAITGFAIAGAAPAAHQLDGALHTVAGLTTGHFLKATGATTFGFAAHGMTYSDVGAAATSHAHAWADITSGLPTTWAPTAHDLLSTSHGDTTAGAVARGDLIVGTGASAKWGRLAVGTIGTIVSSDGTDTKYQSLATLGIAPASAISGTSGTIAMFNAGGTSVGNSILTQSAGAVTLTSAGYMLNCLNTSSLAAQYAGISLQSGAQINYIWTYGENANQYGGPRS